MSILFEKSQLFFVDRNLNNILRNSLYTLQNNYTK